MGFRASLAIFVACLVGCGAARSNRPTVIARGTLAYAALTASRSIIVSIELTERFELVVRELEGKMPLHELTRVDLGPPEADFLALATTTQVAVVGGRDGWLRVFSLPRGTLVTTWPQGAPITALVANSEVVIAGDATGGLCVRSLFDGSLRVCVDTGAAVVDLTLENDLLTTVGADLVRRRFQLPGLSQQPDLHGQPDLHVDGRTVSWRDCSGATQTYVAGGNIRSVTPGPQNTLLVASFISDLSQASIVLLPRR